MNVKYTRQVSYIGRNGMGKQTGLELLYIPCSVVSPPAKSNGWKWKSQASSTVSLSPINSKGQVANCIIDIPVENITEVVNALLEVQKRA